MAAMEWVSKWYSGRPCGEGSAGALRVPGQALLGVMVVLAVIPVLVFCLPAQLVTMPFASLNDSEQPRTFSFLVYGDIQGNYQKSHNALVERMLEESVDLVFNTGDISPDHGEHYARDFYPVIQKLAERVPFFPSLGNHDVVWDSPVSRHPFYVFFSEAFDYLSRQTNNEHLLDSANQKLWYSLLYEDVLFIVLDSNLFIDEGRYRRTHRLQAYRNHLAEQMNWVKNLLEKSSSRPEIRAKFVFFHHSPFISRETRPVLMWGGHPGHRRMVVNQTVPSERSGGKLYLLDLFRLHRVTAVFTGHEHYYERWREVIKDKGRMSHALHWIVSGLGGVKPRGSPDYQEDEIQELLEEEDTYRDYLKRVSDLNVDWKAELQHMYPNESSPEARFPNYVLVEVNGSAVQFQTKDKSGRIRDQGLF